MKLFIKPNYRLGRVHVGIDFGVVTTSLSLSVIMIMFDIHKV